MYPDEPKPVRVLYSLVDPAEIARIVAEQYRLGNPDQCDLVSAGHNDTYEVRIGAESYAFRLQSANWWKVGEGDARFELELLTHLHQNGVPAAYPLPRKNGDLLGVIRAPEAERYYSLFTWAPGNTVDDADLTTEQAHRVGQCMAAIHLAADHFQSNHHRYRLDEQTLLDRSLKELDADLHTAEPGDVRTIEHYVTDIRQRLDGFDPGPGGWGIVHGDVYGGTCISTSRTGSRSSTSTCAATAGGPTTSPITTPGYPNRSAPRHLRDMKACGRWQTPSGTC